MTEPPEDAAKSLWRQQDMETPTMTNLAVRALVRGHGERLRNQLLAGTLLIVAEAVWFGFMALKALNFVALCGYLLVVAGLGWMFWRLGPQRPGRLPDTGASTGTLIAFHRQELQRQKRSYLSLLISAGPVLVGVLVTALGLYLSRPGAPVRGFALLLGLMGLWLILAWAIQRGRARQLQRQLDELDQIEGR
jgi:hypothetical protein